LFGVSPLGDTAPGDDADSPSTQAVSVVPLTNPEVRSQKSEVREDSATSSRTSDLCPLTSDLTERLDPLGTRPQAVPGSAEVFRAAHQTNPAAAQRYAKAVAALPKVGDTFLGFELVGELGQGAFGCVFLANQSAMADRPVALKVASELFGEKLTLARLQHTNIVPIYSVHRTGPFQALCMPYLGNTTLADVFLALQGKRLPTPGQH